MKDQDGQIDLKGVMIPLGIRMMKWVMAPNQMMVMIVGGSVMTMHVRLMVAMLRIVHLAGVTKRVSRTTAMVLLDGCDC